ncbi:MAG: type IV pilus modification PilV family protein [Armatimonadota bacterium]
MYISCNRYSISKQGFTLVEVLMAIFVLALSALMLSAIFPIAQTARIKGLHTTNAVNLAQKRIEELRSAGYSSTEPSTTTAGVTELPNGVETISITQYISNVRKIEVSITWDGYRKVGGSVVLASFISDHS